MLESDRLAEWKGNIWRLATEESVGLPTRDVIAALALCLCDRMALADDIEGMLQVIFPMLERDTKLMREKRLATHPGGRA